MYICTLYIKREGILSPEQQFFISFGQNHLWVEYIFQLKKYDPKRASKMIAYPVKIIIVTMIIVYYYEVIYNRLQTLFMMTFKHFSFTPNHDKFLTNAIPFSAAYGTKPQLTT